MYLMHHPTSKVLSNQTRRLSLAGSSSTCLQTLHQKGKFSNSVSVHSLYFLDYHITITIVYRVPLYTDKNGTDVEIWEPVKSSDKEVRFLELNTNVRMIEDRFVQRRKFWENLGLPDSTAILDDDWNSRNISNRI